MLSRKKEMTASQKNTIPETSIVFMGTPTFAAELLQSLIEAGYKVIGVVTQTDKPFGRKHETKSTPVKEVAEKASIPVFQPEKLDETARKTLSDWKPDLLVVAAYGKILPPNFLKIPSLGSVNVHASLLPRWRGASPIQNALMAGDAATGITLMQMDEGMDTGKIIAQKSLDIAPDETAKELSDRLTPLAAELLLETLPQWIDQSITAEPQPSQGTTLCQLIEREDGRIFWTSPAEEIYNRYRGLTPWPGVFTFWKQGEDFTRVKLQRLSLQKTSPMSETPVGTVFEVGEKIGVRTGEGVIFLEEIQIEGKEAMSLPTFLNGNPDFVGSVLA